MIRLRSFLVPLGFLAVALPYRALAAPFSGSIIPQTGACVCKESAPDYGCALEVLQNLINFAVYFGIILCVFWIAYAGFSLMVSAGNPAGLTQAKTRILNAVVGIAVILSSWIIVDFVMKAVFNPDAIFVDGNIGPWNAIFAPEADSFCIDITQPVAITEGIVGMVFGPNGIPSNSLPSGVGVAQGLCADSNISCSVAVMRQEGLNDRQAQAMSCIAVTESAGGSNKGHSGTGALGLFQITGENWRNAKYHSGSCTSSSSRLDDRCNRQAAVLMFRDSGYQPWTGKCNSQSGCGNVGFGQYWNPNAVACVNKYDPR